MQRLLFSDDLVTEHNNSELIEISDGRAVVFRVDAFHEESTLPLDVVVEKVRDVLKAKKSAEFAESVGQEFIARIENGEDPELVSNEMGLSWSVHADIKRDNIMVSREVVTRVFTLKNADESNGVVEGFAILDGDYTVVKLDSVKSGNFEDTTAIELYSITNMLSDGFGAGDYRSYQDVMVESAEVERL